MLKQTAKIFCLLSGGLGLGVCPVLGQARSSSADLIETASDRGEVQLLMRGQI